MELKLRLVYINVSKKCTFFVSYDKWSQQSRHFHFETLKTLQVLLSRVVHLNPTRGGSKPIMHAGRIGNLLSRLGDRYPNEVSKKVPAIRKLNLVMWLRKRYTASCRPQHVETEKEILVFTPPTLLENALPKPGKYSIIHKCKINSPPKFYIIFTWISTTKFLKVWKPLSPCNFEKDYTNSGLENPSSSSLNGKT